MSKTSGEILLFVLLRKQARILEVVSRQQSVRAPMTAGFSFDDEPTVTSQNELKRAVTSDE